MRIFQLINLYKYPSKEEIEKSCELYGYENYIPYDLFIDLITWCLSYYLEKPVVVECKNSYLKVEFFKSLDIIIRKESTPIKTAVRLLTFIESRYDLRELENDNIVEGQFYNFKEDLCEEELKDFISIMPKDCSKYKLNKILNLSYAIINNSSIQDSEKEYIRMRSIKDMLRIKKSNWVQPNFLEKVSKKEYIIYKESISKGDEKIIIYLEDQTSSMLESVEIIMASRYALLKLCDKTVHFYPFNYLLKDCIVLNSKEDMMELFKTPIEFAQTESNYFNVLNKLQSIYDEGSVFLVTDTDNSVPRSINKKLKINCITNRYNVEMKKLVTSTKGKYIKI